MKKYILHTVKSETIGLDTQVNLRLEISRNDIPTRLSDFAGGVAELYDGYSTATTNFTISLADHDERRIKLTNNDNYKIELAPEFIRHIDSNAPLNQLREIPLKNGQNLYDYKIMNSNWRLR
ncbi:hypothetical protein [Shewanella sp. GutDb-MelDb]|uniref:hypothetical protein n=1 Tax=Shewanella sp. GutDb-MelDb TaxID=2058316 RepID=UPI000C7C32FE|nr:hypothetical protein [Shewanella sp. GutDb-MelDb]PKG59148.1 hypothetical protein CXF82_00785 [Shewanella sp. GutDb-MelDb]